MKQVFTWDQGGSTPGGSTTRYSFINDLNQFWGTTEGTQTVKWSVAGTFSNFAVEMDYAPGSGITVTYTLRVNGADTSVVVTISGTNTTGSDTTNSASIAVGDVLSIKRTVSGGSLIVNKDHARYYMEFDSSGSANGYAVRFVASMATPSAVYGMPFWPVAGDVAEWTADTTDFDRPMPIAGTLTRIDLRNFDSGGAAAALAAGVSVEFTLIKNNVLQDGSGGTTDTRVSLTDASSDANWTGSLALAVGDTLSWRAQRTGSLSTLRATAACSFTPTNAGDFMLGNSANQHNMMGAQTIRYCFANSYGGPIATVTTFGQSVAALTTFYVHRIVALAATAGTTNLGITIHVDGTEAPQTPFDVLANLDTTGSAHYHVMVGANATEPAAAPYAVVEAGSRWGLIFQTVWGGSLALGYKTTVTAPRSVAIGVDGNTNTHGVSGVVKIFGNLEVTGTMSTVAGDLSDELDGLGT